MKIRYSFEWTTSKYYERYNLIDRICNTNYTEYESDEEFDFFMRSHDITLDCVKLLKFEDIPMWEPGAMLDCHKDFLNRVNKKIETLANDIDKEAMYTLLKTGL